MVIDFYTGREYRQPDPEILAIVNLVFDQNYMTKIKVLANLHLQKGRAMILGQKEIAAGIQKSIDTLIKSMGDK